MRVSSGAQSPGQGILDLLAYEGVVVGEPHLSELDDEDF